MNKVLIRLSLLICLTMCVRARAANANESDVSCAEDVRAVIHLMHDAYPGAPTKLAGNIAFAIREAEQRLRRATEQPISYVQCDAAVITYLSAWKDGHISIETRNGPVQWQSSHNSQSYRSMGSDPRWIDLAPRVVVLRIPSFFGTDQSIAALVRRLRKRAPVDTLIVDVRGNAGGNDVAYKALEIELRQRPYRAVGLDARVTRETIDASELLLKLVGERLSEDARKEIVARIRLMRNSDSEWVSFGPSTEYGLSSPSRPSMAEHVAVVVDRNCASSCEQFLLDLRASTDAVFIGTNSAGILDYSNVAPFMLPSHNRALLLPTTRSRRLPEAPIDGVGVAPDIPLDWGECSDTCQWVSALRALREYLGRGGAGAKH